MELDDVALVRASQRGDRDAFGALIARYSRSILSLTSRMLGPVDAEDVAQETFVAAFKALATFKFDSKFSTWLYRIGVNKCTDALRARRPGKTSIDAEPDDGAVAGEMADHETPHWKLEQAELAWELEKGIQALPAVYRESFVLKHIEGLDYDEMSEILGVNRDTLKMRVYKARTLLCQSLAHLDGAHR
ncbi:MAG TPA: sigma-70 family RNA polymerase sigma factor [Vicinamibacterales bacterium]|nr:sigma-70 family RNA polymerase sigma factor [Vicinamibacterales bacterium]